VAANSNQAMQADHSVGPQKLQLISIECNLRQPSPSKFKWADEQQANASKLLASVHFDLYEKEHLRRLVKHLPIQSGSEQLSHQGTRLSARLELAANESDHGLGSLQIGELVSAYVVVMSFDLVSSIGSGQQGNTNVTLELKGDEFAPIKSGPNYLTIAANRRQHLLTNESSTRWTKFAFGKFASLSRPLKSTNQPFAFERPKLAAS